MFHLRNGSTLLECNAVLLQDLELFVISQSSTFARESIIFFPVFLGVLTYINECRNDKYQYFAKKLISRDFSLRLNTKERKPYISIYTSKEPNFQFFKCDYLLNTFCFLASLADDAINVTPSFYSALNEQIILLLYSFLLTEGKPAALLLLIIIYLICLPEWGYKPSALSRFKCE